MNINQGQEKDIKWATMIPLIGGSALGCAKATGNLPQFHLSYSPFSKNEAHLKNYWPQVPMLYLDQLSRMMEFGQEEIDFVNSVCPCAGLSMLNVSKKGQSARGSDAVQNDWILKSAEFVLSYIKPKCLWGENAPGLFDNPGKDLVEKLRVIAEKHYYSFSLVKTNSELHGLPQRRMRTFYFFWKSPTVPLLQWKDTKAPPLAEYLKEIPSWATFQDVYVHEGRASERFRPYQYVLQREGLTHAEFYKKNGRGTVAKYLEKNGLIDDCIMWLQTYYPYETFSISKGGKGSRTHIDVLEHMKRKLEQGLGYWDDSVKLMGNAFTAVISKNIEYAVHPSEDRFFSIRELLHLMGMPHDYQIDRKQNLNHICQNVPVNTAKDWADEVVRFCQGKSEMTQYSFMKQDNVTRSLVETFPPQNPEEIKERAAIKRKAMQVKMEAKVFKQEPAYNIDEIYTQGYPGQYKVEGNYMMQGYPGNFKAEVDIKPVFSKGIKMEPVINFNLNQGVNNLSVASFDRPIQYNPPPTVKPRLSNSVQLSGPIIKIEDDDEPEPKLNPTQTKQFRCGICQYLSPTKENLEAHWRTDCRLVEKPRLVEQPVGMNNVYNCGECGTKVNSIDEMKAHWNIKCTGFAQKQALKSLSQPRQSDKIGRQSMLNKIAALMSNGTISGRRL